MMLELSENKATLFSVEGELIGSVTSSYDTRYYNANWAEQNSTTGWKAICLSTKQLLSGIEKDVLAVSFSGQMMGCLCVDKNGKPLYPSIIWADMRSTKQENHIKEKIDLGISTRQSGTGSAVHTVSKN